MMMIEITIINSSSVNPAACQRPLAHFALPVTVLLSIQCRISRLRAYIEKVLTAPGAAIRRVVTRTKFPVGLSGHRIDRQTPQVDFLFGGQLAYFGCIYALLPATAHRASGYNIDAVDEGLQVRRIVVGIVYAKDSAIANDYFAAWIDY